MRRITFLFGVHNHQPVGNFDFVFEEAYRKAYRPFLDAVIRHPQVRVAVHNSGILLDWFRTAHPEYLDDLGALIAAGRVEAIGGGWYEPILPVIPRSDAVGQIGKMRDWIRNEWGSPPTGLWLAERVWEPSLVGALAESGVRWLMVDDAHFLAAGAEASRLWNWWLTEDGGATVGVWPISRALRYLVPFEPPEKTIAFLKELAAGGADRVALLADDGEKFGLWPDTFDQVHTRGWLDRFFTLLAENSSWLSMELPGRVQASRPPEGRIYLPTASYGEMMEWALPATIQNEFHHFAGKLNESKAPGARFVRGGFWRNFLAKYPESNWMQQRMLGLRARLDAATLEPAARSAILDDIWQGQCNCAYWHGVFGGLYLPHLRDGIYRHLLRAESSLDKAPHGGAPFVLLDRGDYDRDGQDEIRIGNSHLGLLVAPSRGGAIEEIDIYAPGRNISHGLTRREEAYHELLREAARLREQEPAAVGAEGGRTTADAGDSVRSIHDRIEMKEPDLDRKLVYDWYRRLSLLDHILRDDATAGRFDAAEPLEQGDFLTGAYTATTHRSDGEVRIDLVRPGGAWLGGRFRDLVIDKSLVMTPGESAVRIDYRLRAPGAEPVACRLGIEFNFTMLAGNAPDRYYRIDGKKPATEPHLGGRGEHDAARSVMLVDDWEKVSVELSWSRPALLWRMPIDTISQSEAGFERVYQSSCVMPQWRIDLPPGGRFTLSLTLRVETRE